VASLSMLFKLLGKDVSASKALKGVGTTAGKTGKRFEGMSLAAGVSLAAVGAAAIKLGTDSVKAFTESEVAQTKLQDAYDRFPKLADGNIEALRELGKERAKVTRFDDDATAAAAAQLAQFGLNQKQLEELIPLVQDYASKTGQDLAPASAKVGKALIGNTKALKELGIVYKPTGDKAEDFANIQALLNEKVGGFAEKEGKTAAGQAAILSNQFGELQESIGEQLLPALLAMADVLLPIVASFNDLPSGVKTATVVIGGLGTAFLLLAPKIAAAKALLADFSSTSKAGGVGAAAGSVGKFRGTLGKVAGFLGAAGPWGLAIGAGITALSLFGDNSEEAARAQGSFRAALDASNGALDEQVRKSVAVEAENRGLLKTARELGLSEKDVVNAILGDTAARDKLAAATQRVLNKQVPYVNAGKSGVVVVDQQREAAKRLANGLSSLGVEFDDQVKANDRVQAALGETSAKMLKLQRLAAKGATLKIKVQSYGDGSVIVPSQGGGKKILDIPKMAKGGIVTRPTLAMIGEAGPEAVVPLSRAGMGGGPTVVQLVLPNGKVIAETLVDYRNSIRRPLGLG